MVQPSARSVQVLCAAALAAAVLAAPAPAQAELYQWVDARGVTHFSDDAGRAPAGALRAEPSSAGWNTVASTARTARAERYEVALVTPGADLRVRGRFAPGREVDLVLDTGSELNLIPAKLARQLGMAPAGASAQVRGVDGRVRALEVVRAPELRIGDAALRDLEFAVMPGLPVVVIGMPVLSRHRLETDPRAGTVTLEPVARRAESALETARFERLEWGAVAGAAGYRVEVALDDGFRQVVDRVAVDENRLDAARVTRTLPRGTFFWRVAALDAEGDTGPWSATRTFDRE